MKLRKNIIFLLLALMVLLAGCGQGSQQSSDDQDAENTESNVSVEDVKYDISKESVEVKDKNIEIFYPEVVDYPGELLMGYMNQSLKEIADIYSDSTSYSNVSIDYEIGKMDDDILSVIFRGSANMEGIGDINILDSVNLDVISSNEIEYDNFIKEDKEDKVKEILDEKLKDMGMENGLEAEGIRIYFKDDNVVFYYMPLDDSAKEFVEVSVPMTEIEDYTNESFGEAPVN
ncbi:hypothetical protein [Clostridiisalibacter paucivorans]|uniref:hypothetical protein n=1 Tax=Clostridiisalibacter paucivorans TaxID=408753 RepID=UPI00047E3BB9|nr:hypothetical protein [Clostridiisalibacter paucivorans]